MARTAGSAGNPFTSASLEKANTVFTVVTLASSVLADVGETSFPVWIFFVYLAIVAVGLWINWRITQKAGFPGWYSLGLIVPFFGLILVVLFAFSEWPIERELRLLRSMALKKPAPAPARILP